MPRSTLSLMHPGQIVAGQCFDWTSRPVGFLLRAFALGRSAEKAQESKAQKKDGPVWMGFPRAAVRVMPRAARHSSGGYCYQVFNRGVGRVCRFEGAGDCLAFVRVFGWISGFRRRF